MAATVTPLRPELRNYQHMNSQGLTPNPSGYIQTPDYFDNPPQQQWLELPLIFKHCWQAWPDVDQALIELEFGMFRKAAWLSDAMLMDDRLFGCLSTRINGLLGCDLEFLNPGEEEGEEPEGAQAEANAAIEELYPRMIPRAVEADIDRWGMMLNTGLAELVWQYDMGLWIPQLKVWNPQNLFWRPDTRAYNLTTMEDTIEIKPGNGQWALFTPNRNHYGWMYGLVRPLARLWLQRMYTFRDWARWSEVYGNGIKKAFVPMGGDKEDMNTFMSGLMNPGTESVVMCPVPKADDRAKGGYDVEMLQVQEGTGWQGFEGAIKQMDTSIAVCMLGQNLSTESKPTGLGAGTAKLQSNVRRDFLRADSQNMGEFLRDQVLHWFCKFNFGDDVRAPIPHRKVDPPEDQGAVAKSLSDLGNAINAFAQNSMPIDYRALFDRLDVPTIKDGEELQVQVPDPAAVPLLDDVRDPGSGIAFPDDPRHLEDLKLLKTQAVKRRTSTKGAAYVDKLAKTAKVEAARVMRKDLTILLTIIDQSQDANALRASLIRRYKTMNPHAMAELTEKVLVLAQMAGRKAAQEE